MTNQALSEYLNEAIEVYNYTYNCTDAFVFDQENEIIYSKTAGIQVYADDLIERQLYLKQKNINMIESKIKFIQSLQLSRSQSLMVDDWHNEQGDLIKSQSLHDYVIDIKQLLEL